MERLKGKVALVTGAGRGIGAATARRLASEGASVVVADINEETAQQTVDAISGDGGDAHPVRADVAVEADVAAMVQAAVDTFGGLDVLHNNATQSYRDHHIHDGGVLAMDAEIWRRTWEVNLLGPALACRHAIPRMLERGGGSIINMSSGAATAGDFATTGYACTKRAVETLTMYVATQHGKEGIRCNAIIPGAIETEGLQEVFDDASRAMVARHNLTPYAGQPEDIAAAVAFLASQDARFVTGQLIAVNGGIHSHQPFYGEIVAGMSTDSRHADAGITPVSGSR